MAQTAARIVVELTDGSRLDADIPLALGNPDNPMNWDDMWRKFEPLVEPTLGDRTRSTTCSVISKNPAVWTSSLAWWRCVKNRRVRTHYCRTVTATGR